MFPTALDAEPHVRSVAHAGAHGAEGRFTYRYIHGQGHRLAIRRNLDDRVRSGVVGFCRGRGFVFGSRRGAHRAHGFGAQDCVVVRSRVVAGAGGRWRQNRQRAARRVLGHSQGHGGFQTRRFDVHGIEQPQLLKNFTVTGH